jgi:DNA polymerase III delta subunit
MIYAQIDDQRDRQELQQAMQAAKQSNWYRRLKIIDLSSRGYKVRHLAQVFDLSAATISL